MGGCHEPVMAVTEQNLTVDKETALPRMAFGGLESLGQSRPTWTRLAYNAGRIHRPKTRNASAWRRLGETKALGEVAAAALDRGGRLG